MTTDTPDWQSASFIRDELARQASPQGIASASVFLDAGVADDDLDDVAARLVAEARMDGVLRLGRVRSLSKSFSVEGDPDAVARLNVAREVTSILPASIDDIHPRPVNVKDVDQG